MTEIAFLPTRRVVFPGEIHAFPAHDEASGLAAGDAVVASLDGEGASSGIGVLCSVERTALLGAGTLVVTLRGESRVGFEVVAHDQRSYRARVRVLEVAGPGAAEARSRVVGGARRYRATLTELGYPSDVLAAVPEDPIDASYRLASVLRVSEPERQHVLESPTAAERLELLATVFARERGLLEATISAGGR